MALLVACLFLIQPDAFAAEPDISPEVARLSAETQKALAEQPALVQSIPTGKEEIVVQTQIFEKIDPKDIGTLVEIYSKQTGKEPIVSTDSPEVVDAVAKNFEKSERKGRKVKKPSFLMFGEKAKNYVSNTISETKESIAKNKVGLAITVAMTSYDTVLWFQATDLDMNQKVTMTMFNWLVNLKFGIDPDAWSNATEAIDNKFMAILEKTGLAKQTGNLNGRSAFLRRYFANFGMYFALQSTRFSILNYDHLLSSMQSAHFWVPIATIAAAGSFTSFGWGEFSMKIKESQHPIAKKTVKIFAYLRQFFMGAAAPSSSLINGNSLTPWAIVVGHGVAGLAAFYQKRKIVNWLEGSIFTSWLRSKTKKVNSVLPSRMKLNVPSQCSAVFAN